ncbi:hypothetical protein GGI19_003421 [Coemansia pectinata]|uniref:Uncharacterized protein n=1 Tax=Coemansia pectinata TaxID=1052879 RepID=A0A9W8GU66_9FUNG|nr:hypothetical protein GGI19_003421 [Coemansia pectinata]
MRYFTVIVLIACLMALCNASIVAIYNRNKSIQIDIKDTACVKVDTAFNVSSNNVYSAGYPASFFANNDCTYLVGMAYAGNKDWQFIPRPILSVSVLKSW